MIYPYPAELLRCGVRPPPLVKKYKSDWLTSPCMLGNPAGAETAICTFAAGEVGTGLGFKMQRQAAGILPLSVLVPNVNRPSSLTTTGARQAVTN